MMGLQAWPRLSGVTLIFGGKTLSFDTVIIAQSRDSFPGGYRKIFSSRTACKSSGRGASNSIFSPVMGCANLRYEACRNCRLSGTRLKPLPDPYTGSPPDG